MKTQAELAALENQIDFGALNNALLERMKRGDFGQRKTVSTLLDRIADTLVELRRQRVSLRQIVQELRAHGLEVSESRLRAWLRNRGVNEPEAKARSKKARSRVNQAVKRSPAPLPKATARDDQPQLILR